MKNLLNTSRFLAILVVCFLAFAFPAVSSAQAKSVPSPVGITASLASLRNLGDQQCIQPPQNINMMTLSDAQLSLYGLPSRSTLESNPAFWTVQLAYYKHRTCETGPSLLNHGRLNPDVTASPSSNWAGNDAYGSRGTYRAASVAFRVPGVSGSNGSVSSFWAGVGGVASNYGLVQAGVDEERASATYQYNHAWWEYHIGSNGVDSSSGGGTFTGLPVYPGDTMSVYVESNINSDGYDYFQVCSSHGGGSCQSKTVSGNFSDSANGECIGERIGGAPIANFGTEELSGCYMTNSSLTTNGIGNWPHNYYYLTDGSRTLVSVGSISSGANYPLYWHYAT